MGESSSEESSLELEDVLLDVLLLVLDEVLFDELLLVFDDELESSSEESSLLLEDELLLVFDDELVEVLVEVEGSSRESSVEAAASAASGSTADFVADRTSTSDASVVAGVAEVVAEVATVVSAGWTIVSLPPATGVTVALELADRWSWSDTTEESVRAIGPTWGDSADDAPNGDARPTPTTAPRPPSQRRRR